LNFYQSRLNLMSPRKNPNQRSIHLGLLQKKHRQQLHRKRRLKTN
jgi:hypothetical protein